MAKNATVLAEFEETAILGAKAVREFLKYQGSNKDYLHRAKAGAAAMGSYSRVRATMANESALRLAAAKTGPSTLALMAGDEEE